MVSSFVTAAELAAWLRDPTLATAAATKDLLEEVLAATIENVESKVGPLEPASGETDLTVTYTVYPSGRNLVLPVTHLTGTVEVKDPDGNTVIPRDVNMLAGIVELPVVPRQSRPWTVRSSCREHGQSVKLAVKIIAAHLWQLQRRRPPAGPQTETGDEAPRGSGFAIPRRAAELLAHFMRDVVG
jgi:hypothetical protein